MPTDRQPQSDAPGRPPRVVIVGGGFGGLYLARSLRKADVAVTLIDRRNHHLFQPLLYQVATGGLSPGNIAAPLRALVGRHRNTRVLMAEVTGFDVVRKRVLLEREHDDVPYDYLVLAAGMQNAYFGHPEWSDHAPGLKSIEEATEIRSRVLGAFEAAERTQDPDEARKLMTFVIVGGGPTGVELAGTLAEIARATLKSDFRTINTHDARVILIEAEPRVLAAYTEKLSHRAEKSLRKLGVTVRCGQMVKEIAADGVRVDTGDGTEWIDARTVLWGAGLKASPLGEKLADACGIEAGKHGRVPVEPNLSVKGHPDVFVIGDIAVAQQDGKELPGLAPVAMQQGKYVATLLRKRVAGQSVGPFRYHAHGKMATIGRAAAVADIGWLKFSGFPAWLAWLFVHLMFLVQFENRFLVFIQWAYNYITFSRSARLITHPHRIPETPLMHYRTGAPNAPPHSRSQDESAGEEESSRNAPAHASR